MFSNYKRPWLVDSYSGAESEIDLTEARQTSLNYTSKNLANQSATPGTVNDGMTKSAVAHTETLYEDADNDGVYYYVVKLTENVKHFFLSGWFDEMSAPVVAVAKISRTGSGNGGNNLD